MARVVVLVLVTLLIVGGAWFVLVGDAPSERQRGDVGVVRPGSAADLGDPPPTAPGAEADAAPVERLDVAAPEAAAEPPPEAPVASGPRATVVGTVVFDETDAPLADVRVLAHVTGPDGAPRATVEAATDAAGRYALAVPLDAGRARLALVEVPAGDDHAQATVSPREDLTADARVTVDVRVAPTVTVRGTVVDLSDEPIEGAVVRGWSVSPMVLDGSLIDDPGVAAETDALGRFVLAGTGPRFTLTAEAEGRVAHERLWSTASKPRDVDGLVLRVSDARRIDGRVVDAGGQGVAGVPVTARLTGPPGLTETADIMRTGPRTVRATTDADGDFTLAGLADRELTVEVDSPDHPPWRGRHAPGEAGMLIRLEVGGGLSGLVLGADGTAAAGAQVRFAEGVFTSGRDVRTTETGDNGRFTFYGLPETDEGVVDVLADGHAPWVRQDVTISSFADAPPMQVLLERQAILAGVVVDEDGAGVADAPISVIGERVIDLDAATMFPLPTWERRVGRADTRSDDEGRFRLPNLYPGTFTIRVTDPDDPALTLSEQVVASADDLRLVLDPDAIRGVVLRGRVVDALTGLPVPEFRVTAMVEQGKGDYAGAGRTFEDADGRYVVQGLEPGSMIVRVSADGYADFDLPPTDYDLGEHVIDVELPPARELHLRLVDERGAPLVGNLSFADDAGKSVAVQVAAYSYSNSMSTDESGEVIARGLPAGPVAVTATVAGYGVPTQRTFDLTQPLRGVQEIVVEDPVKQDVLVVVVRPSGDGDAALPPDSASVSDRLVDIVGKLVDGQLAAVPGPVEVALLGAGGVTIGVTELDPAATAAVMSDTSAAESPIAVQIQVPVGSSTIRIAAPGHEPMSKPWDATEDEAGDLGLLVFVL